MSCQLSLATGKYSKHEQRVPLGDIVLHHTDSLAAMCCSVRQQVIVSTTNAVRTGTVWRTVTSLEDSQILHLALQQRAFRNGAQIRTQ